MNGLIIRPLAAQAPAQRVDHLRVNGVFPPVPPWRGTGEGFQFESRLWRDSRHASQRAREEIIIRESCSAQLGLFPRRPAWHVGPLSISCYTIHLFQELGKTKITSSGKGEKEPRTILPKVLKDDLARHLSETGSNCDKNRGDEINGGENTPIPTRPLPRRRAGLYARLGQGVRGQIA